MLNTAAANGRLLSTVSISVVSLSDFVNMKAFTHLFDNHMTLSSIQFLEFQNCSLMAAAEEVNKANMKYIRWNRKTLTI